MVTVLVLHGGGFVGGTPASVEPIAKELRGDGYNAIAVPYRNENPTGNVLGEIATVRRYVKDAEGYGPVIAYGVSAGGTLAAALAARGEIAGAVVAGGPTNLLTWVCVVPPVTVTPSFWNGIGMSVADRRAASPYFRLDGHQSPQLLLYGDIDPIVPIDQGLNYFRAALKGQPDTKYTLMPISPHAFRQPYRTEARQWIQQRWPVSGKGARLTPGRLKTRQH